MRSELDKLSIIKQILELFAIFIKKIEADKTVSISVVLPELLNIKAKLKKMLPSGILEDWIQNLLKDIDNRFKFALDPDDISFNIVYSLATFLDPKYFPIVKKKDAKRYYIKVVSYLESCYSAASELIPAPVDDDYQDSSDKETETSSFDEIQG